MSSVVATTKLVTGKRCQKRKNAVTNTWETSWVPIECSIALVPKTAGPSKTHLEMSFDTRLFGVQNGMFWDQKTGLQIQVPYTELADFLVPFTYGDIFRQWTCFPEAIIDHILCGFLEGSRDLTPEYRVVVLRDSVREVSQYLDVSQPSHVKACAS